mmetsp:Transcript_41058/g.45868  ORF Transcript_41058/g.45868 Transcript_41058/m.45868 type:complete len:664 (-) Transcript_41058:294-2285(-)
MTFLLSDTLERSLTSNFGKSVVEAIIDFIDDVGSSGNCSEGSDKNQEQQQYHQYEGDSNDNYDYNKGLTSRKSMKTISTDYDPTHLLDGDCLNVVTSSSVATIVECATMKTSNTAAPSPIISPCNSTIIDPSSKIKDTSNTIVVSHQRSQNEEEHDDDEDNEDDNRYHWISPLNSIISEEAIQQYVIDNNDSNFNSSSNIHSEYFRKYESNRNRAGKNNVNVGKNNSSSNNNNYGTEDEDWFSTSSSSSSWCGGVPTILFYNHSLEEEEESVSEQYQQKENFVHNDYYAKYKPHRQYAFDEGDIDVSIEDVDDDVDDDDGQYTVGTTTTTGQITDDDDEDENSVQTGFNSIQSFMMINHPHKNASQMQVNRQSQLSSSSSSSAKMTMPNRYHTHKMMDTSFSSATFRIEQSTLSPTPIFPHLHKYDNNSYEEQEKGERVTDPSEYALTQSFMRKLQRYLPFSKRGDSFWLQYSLVRDGASLDSLLDMFQPQQVDLNNNVCSVLAIETLEGEIFGAFVTQSWRRSNNQWYGGGQSFLWTTATKSCNNGGNRKDKMNRRHNNSNSNTLEVYMYSFANSYVQLCDNDRLLIGAGDDGFGIAIERDLFTGSSNPCTTFSSPSLSKLHSDGSTFEILNLEIWTLTPCLSMVENKLKGLTRVHSKNSKI